MATGNLITGPTTSLEGAVPVLMFSKRFRVTLADVIAADNGTGTLGYIVLLNLAVGDTITNVAWNLTTPAVVSDSGTTLVASIGDSETATQFTAAKSVLGTATPILQWINLGTENKSYAATDTLRLSLTPETGKNLSTVTAFQMDIFVLIKNITALSAS